MSVDDEREPDDPGDVYGEPNPTPGRRVSWPPTIFVLAAEASELPVFPNRISNPQGRERRQEGYFADRAPAEYGDDDVTNVAQAHRISAHGEHKRLGGPAPSSGERNGSRVGAH